MSPQAAPAVAIVIPVFKHSALMFEAVASALDQQGPEAAHIVIIDDGCPHLQTHWGGCELAALSANVHYVRQGNGGLSSARNRGVDYVLSNLPDCEAIFFLDADNRLSPFSVHAFAEALRLYPDWDWFYPDIRMFGLEWHGSYAGPFSPVVQALMNLCEAGSLVRRRVFESGVRFDEQMRDGFEDWEFWIAAFGSGFRGKPLPSLGLWYRRRVESMLADSARRAEAIRSYMERKHPWTRNTRRLVELEHWDAPRYAILLLDEGVVRLTSDPAQSVETLGLDDYEARYWAAALQPNAHNAGAFLVATTAAALRQLEEDGLLAWAFWDAEMRGQRHNLVVLDAPGDPALRIELGEPRPGRSGGVLAMTSMRLARSTTRHQADNMIGNSVADPRAANVGLRSVQAPRPGTAPALPSTAHQGLVAYLLRLRSSAFRNAHAARQGDVALGSPDRAAINAMLRQALKGIVPPHRGAGTRRIAFLVPIFDFGGVEKVAFFVAKALRQFGFECHLVVFGNRPVQTPPGFRDVFDEVFIIDNPEFEDWSGPDYFGTDLSRWSMKGHRTDVLNLLSLYDVVINCHASDALGVMSDLRRQGAITISYQHLLEYTASQRTVGQPFRALAFEHAFDLFVGCSEQMAADLRALGVPDDKVIAVPNAPGMDLAKASLQALAQPRQVRKGPLRVLYLGRLDRQKAVERVAALREQLRPNKNVVFRLVGKAIYGDSSFDEREVEPPVYDDVQLAELYNWADVFVMCSRYEGLPLSLLEAMHFGAVPVVLRAGAIEEAVEPNVSGFVIDQAVGVAGLAQTIAALAADRDLLVRTSRAAQAAVASRTWGAAVVPLAEALDRRLAAKGRPPRATVHAIRPEAALAAGAD